MAGVHIHSTAEVSPDARVGEGTRVWSLSQIREGARIGQDCNIGRNVYIGADVSIGDRCKVQNNASLYEGLTIASGVFIGPHVCFCNDVLPRAITPDGQLKSAEDWVIGPTRVLEGASVGAGAIVVPNVTIGRFALVGAGSVVTRSVPDHALVYGNPARIAGYVCSCGQKLVQLEQSTSEIRGTCPVCHTSYTLPVPESQ